MHVQLVYTVGSRVVHLHRSDSSGWTMGGFLVIKAGIPQEVVKPVSICPKESFPLLLAEGTYGYAWGPSAYQNSCWPQGPFGVTSTIPHQAHSSPQYSYSLQSTGSVHPHSLSIVVLRHYLLQSYISLMYICICVCLSVCMYLYIYHLSIHPHTLSSCSFLYFLLSHHLNYYLPLSCFSVPTHVHSAFLSLCSPLFRMSLSLSLSHFLSYIHDKNLPLRMQRSFQQFLYCPPLCT